MTEIPDPEDVIGRHWPLHGPYDHDRTITAAALLGETVRYLNYATGQGARSALPYASTVGDVVSGIGRAAALLDQTLRQLSARCAQLADDPTLYDHDDPADHALAVTRTESARQQLAAAAQGAASLHTALSAAQTHLNHLGHKDT